jgi:tripartite-type tricarboxylate transporter receptor subunit TctC
MPNTRILAAAAVLFLIGANAKGVQANDFYLGKTITITSGSGVGGGYDVYARLLAQFIGRHIPGNPRVVVENRLGAGTRVATTYVYNIAPKDGTAIGNSVNLLPFDQFVFPEANRTYDLSKVQFIGNMAALTGMIVVNQSAGIRTFEEAKHKVVTLGSNSRFSETYVAPAIINAVGGTKFHIVQGFPSSTHAIDLAMERNEVSGRAGGWSAYRVKHPNWVEDGKLFPLVQMGMQEAAVLKGRGVPMLTSLAETDEQRAIYQAISMGSLFSRAYWLAPEVPAERVAILSKAFDAVMEDPEFLAYADKHNFEITPSSAAMVNEAMGKMKAIVAGLQPQHLQKIRAALKN